MREILFRGQLPEAGIHAQGHPGQWVSGPGITIDKSGGVQVWAHEENGLCNYVVNPATVGQFTGRLDKNGTKIFEGDVVRIGIPGDCFVTEWWDYGASFILRQKGGAPDITFDEYDEEAYEVAGNVHDNPELPEAAR